LFWLPLIGWKLLLEPLQGLPNRDVTRSVGQRLAELVARFDEQAKASIDVRQEGQRGSVAGTFERLLERGTRSSGLSRRIRDAQ
jgi:hypothetical protein